MRHRFTNYSRFRQYQSPFNLEYSDCSCPLNINTLAANSSLLQPLVVTEAFSFLSYSLDPLLVQPSSD